VADEEGRGPATREVFAANGDTRNLVVRDDDRHTLARHAECIADLVRRGVGSIEDVLSVDRHRGRESLHPMVLVVDLSLGVNRRRRGRQNSEHADADDDLESLTPTA